MEHVIIEIKDYPKYWIKIAEMLGTTNISELYSKHTASCANCESQFTKEALQHLAVFSNFGDLRGKPITIWGANKQGNDWRAGKCPNCGSNKMRIYIYK
jgi:Zn finger protein HypA/HybF involved in hydrogenase expression